MKRNTRQFLISDKRKAHKSNSYDIYPAHPVSEGKIETGYKSLANTLIGERTIILDGYIGVDWEEVINGLSFHLREKGKSLDILDIRSCLRPESELRTMVEPFLGGDDPIFGYRTNIGLHDYFDADKIAGIVRDENVDIQIIYGTGATQSGIDGLLVYFDLPKNELQYRMRAGKITNLGYICRYEFKDTVEIETQGQCHLLILVEGTSIALCVNGDGQTLHYAKTFTVPAAGNYRLKNKGAATAKVIVSFVNEEAC